jgi:membrane-anchored protein YejM (alkaline phosphatase superfamily)
MLGEYTGSDNFLLITLDSCRWDTFNNARAPCLKSKGNFMKAYAQGTYTLPSHISMFTGIFPNTAEAVPYYNRFKKSLFRKPINDSPVDAFVVLPADSEDIISSMGKMGYETFGCGAMEWFKNTILHSKFDAFNHTGINIEKQLEWTLEKIKKIKKPFFSFINIGETHEPYKIENVIPSSLSRARMRSFSNEGFLHADYENQIKSIEYIDRKLKPFFDKVQYLQDNRTIVIVCADHGECFGEDGLYGHGFYHPKVMEVPLGIFII